MDIESAADNKILEERKHETNLSIELQQHLCVSFRVITAENMEIRVNLFTRNVCRVAL